MGFLDNSTNNIILDAVLTDTGRNFLARNNGSFSIFKFALGDDEVDYKIIKKYGRTVGREKIEKNTPIFEGLTNQGYAQKHKLVTVSNPNLTRLPNIELTASTTNTVTLSNMTGGTKFQTLSLQQKIVDATENIDVELIDQAFIVMVPNLFLEIQSRTPSNIDGNQMASYYLTKTGTSDSAGGSKVEFRLNLKSLSSSLFAVYGINNVITTYVRVQGINSGATRDIKVVINNA